MGYPELLKLVIILDQFTICVTDVRQIKSGKLIKWFKQECFQGSLLTIIESGRYLRIKSVKKYKTGAKDAEIVFTFPAATL